MRVRNDSQTGVETLGANPIGATNLFENICIFIDVIRLKDILMEGRERSNCWISPSGRIIPVTDTHATTAFKISPGHGQKGMGCHYGFVEQRISSSDVDV